MFCDVGRFSPFLGLEVTLHFRGVSEFFLGGSRSLDSIFEYPRRLGSCNPFRSSNLPGGRGRGRGVAVSQSRYVP